MTREQLVGKLDRLQVELRFARDHGLASNHVKRLACELSATTEKLRRIDRKGTRSTDATLQVAP